MPLLWIAALTLLAADVQVGNKTGVIRSAKEIPEPGMTESSVYIEIPHIKQEPYLCVPTAAAMVLEYFGDPQPPRKLKVLSKGGTYDRKAPFDDYTITWWRDLNKGLKTLGYTWREAGFPNDAAGFEAGLSAVKSSLRRGNPVLVDVALYTSHTFVIVGYDDETRRVFINDPNLLKPGARVLTYDQLESIWNGVSYGQDIRPTLFVERKRE